MQHEVYRRTNFGRCVVMMKERRRKKNFLMTNFGCQSKGERENEACFAQ